MTHTDREVAKADVTPEGQSSTGRELYRQFLSELNEKYPDKRKEIMEFVQSEGRIVFEALTNARGPIQAEMYKRLAIEWFETFTHFRSTFRAWNETALRQ